VRLVKVDSELWVVGEVFVAPEEVAAHPLLEVRLLDVGAHLGDGDAHKRTKFALEGHLLAAHLLGSGEAGQVVADRHLFLHPFVHVLSVTVLQGEAGEGGVAVRAHARPLHRVIPHHLHQLTENCNLCINRLLQNRN